MHFHFLALGIVWKENLPLFPPEDRALPAGVPAAFQALFGEGMEKTDTGLEAAFAKVDEDMKDRGKIDTDDMKAFITNLYDRPRELKRTEALWARMAREHAEKESNEHLQRRRASTTLLADVHAIEPALPKEFSWRAFETPNGDKIDLLTMQRNQHIPSMCRGPLSDPLPLSCVLSLARSLPKAHSASHPFGAHETFLFSPLTPWHPALACTRVLRLVLGLRGHHCACGSVECVTVPDSTHAAGALDRALGAERAQLRQREGAMWHLPRR
jgi:polyhydroxyalkanoate synthesis regulator phasin